jgi:hypothetical protein
MRIRPTTLRKLARILILLAAAAFWMGPPRPPRPPGCPGPRPPRPPHPFHQGAEAAQPLAPDESLGGR